MDYTYIYTHINIITHIYTQKHIYIHIHICMYMDQLIIQENIGLLDGSEVQGKADLRNEPQQLACDAGALRECHRVSARYQ